MTSLTPAEVRALMQVLLAARRLRKEIVTTDCGAVIDRPEYAEATALEFDAALEAWEQAVQSEARPHTQQVALAA